MRCLSSSTGRCMGACQDVGVGDEPAPCVTRRAGTSRAYLVSYNQAVSPGKPALCPAPGWYSGGSQQPLLCRSLKTRPGVSAQTHLSGCCAQITQDKQMWKGVGHRSRPKWQGVVILQSHTTEGIFGILHVLMLGLILLVYGSMPVYHVLWL